MQVSKVKEESNPLTPPPRSQTKMRSLSKATQQSARYSSPLPSVFKRLPGSPAEGRLCPQRDMTRETCNSSHASSPAADVAPHPQPSKRSVNSAQGHS